MIVKGRSKQITRKRTGRRGKKRWPIIIGLKFCAYFLNQDFESMSRREFNSHKNGWLKMFLKMYGYKSLEGIQVYRKIQAKIRQVLTPLIADGGKDATLNEQYSIVGEHLGALVKILNGSGLKPNWSAEYGTHELCTYSTIQTHSKDGKQPSFMSGQWRKFRNPEIKHLGISQRKLKVGQTKWIIRSTYTASSLLNQFYGIIVKALEDGELSKLRICKHCQSFFVADDIRQKFCKSDCTTAYHDKKALDRVRRSRKLRKIREERKMKYLRPN